MKAGVSSSSARSVCQMNEAMTGIYELTLRAPDGRERRTLAWFPTEEVRQDLHEKAEHKGLTIEENKIIEL